jgi:hypothetical protein
MPVQINKLSMLNSYIEYKEKNDRSDSSGRVRFLNTDLTITNITNRPTANKICEWNFKARLLGKTNVRANVRFDLQQQEKGVFHLTGNIDKVDATAFNELSIPMALNKFERGVINNATFSFDGDNYAMNGSVHVDYDDLRIVMLKKKENNEIKKSRLKTLITNLMVKSTNKRKQGKQTVQVNYQRDTTKSFFNTTWKAIFKGITEILLIVK